MCCAGVYSLDVSDIEDRRYAVSWEVKTNIWRPLPDISLKGNLLTETTFGPVSSGDKVLLNKLDLIFHDEVSYIITLKGQFHEIFHLNFSSWNISAKAPNWNPSVNSPMVSNMWRY
jgi:hypothetical protein